MSSPLRLPEALVDASDLADKFRRWYLKFRGETAKKLNMAEENLYGEFMTYNGQSFDIPLWMYCADSKNGKGFWQEKVLEGTGIIAHFDMYLTVGDKRKLTKLYKNTTGKEASQAHDAFGDINLMHELLTHDEINKKCDWNKNNIRVNIYQLVKHRYATARTHALQHHGFSVSPHSAKIPNCHHGYTCSVLKSRTDKNFNRLFFTCNHEFKERKSDNNKHPCDKRCNFFQWVDKYADKIKDEDCNEYSLLRNCILKSGWTGAWEWG